MVAPDALWFAFHFSLKTYVLAALIAYTPSTNAAFGENVPAKPPLSFHATSWSAAPLTLTKMPMSWLKPALAVHRSALPPSRTVALTPVNEGLTRRFASISVQVAPSLEPRLYCCVLAAPATSLVGTSWAVRRVGE